jgi:trehalose/maltose hydrolase-like predicted phosphorylase
LGHAPTVLDSIPSERRQELSALVSLDDDELARWDDISRKLFVPFHDGVISQFEGYERLEELDWDAYRAKYGDIQRLDRILEAEGDSANRYKLSKQADVLMLFYLFSFDELSAVLRGLGYDFEAGTVDACIDYYLPRTSNGSTLSRIVHSWVLARRDRTQSLQLLKEALESDVSDVQGGTTAEGIHLGAMAGTVDLVQRGQTALEIADGMLHLNPCVPEELKSIGLRLIYRGCRLEAEVGFDKVVVGAPEDWPEPNKICVGHRLHTLRGGDRLEFETRLRGGGWRPITQTVKRKKEPAAGKKPAAKSRRRSPTKASASPKADTGS